MTKWIIPHKFKELFFNIFISNHPEIYILIVVGGIHTQEVKKDYPNLNVKNNVRWVDGGNIITSAGISAGIDMSLHLVSKIINEELVIKTAKQMDFDWTKNL